MMEAPEKIWIDPGIWQRTVSLTDDGPPPKRWFAFDSQHPVHRDTCYVRSDLCAMPEELVEKLKTEVAMFASQHNTRVTALLRDILAWHEGQKGEQE
jgi:hypothetical protein